jgi:hypothetical protein
LLEAHGVFVDRGKRLLAGRFDLVLWLAGAEPLLEVGPEPVLAIVRHLEEAADVLRLTLNQKDFGVGGIPVPGGRANAVAFEEAEREERVEEIQNVPTV